jgi:hypothetical protein
MSLLRILLEGDHGFSIRYSPMTYQHQHLWHQVVQADSDGARTRISTSRLEV